MRNRTFFVVVLLVSLRQASAFQNHKFVAWFPMFEDALKFSWQPGGQCHDLYHDFVYKGKGNCGFVLNCILENTDERRKSTMASAQVVLGIAPSLLAALGSSVAEISILAENSPVLMLFLILGAPATYQTRIYEFTQPLKALKSLPGDMGISQVPNPMWWPIAVLRYFLAVAAAANNIELLLNIGSQSVLAWGCKSWWMPMVWILFSLTIYVAAGLSQMKMTKRIRRKLQNQGTIRRRPLPPRQSPSFSPPLRQHLGEPNKPRLIPTSAVAFQLAASILAFVQVVLGTLILSSLIFIGFQDTLIILARLMSSALICRVIAMFELARIHKIYEARD